MNMITEYIIDKMIMYRAITENNRLLYTYGVESLIFSFVNHLTFIVVGILMGCPLELIIFYISFKVLRSYTGGFHAKTVWGCYGASTLLMFLVSLILVSYKKYQFYYICIPVLVIGLGVIIYKGIVESENKQLEEQERVRYLQIRKLIIIMFALLEIAMLSLNTQFALSIALSFFVTGILLLIKNEE